MKIKNILKYILCILTYNILVKSFKNWSKNDIFTFNLLEPSNLINIKIYFENQIKINKTQFFINKNNM